MRGTTDQNDDGLQMPAIVAVTDDGRRVIGHWVVAIEGCGGVPPSLAVVNYSPATQIGPDGRFKRAEFFRTKYEDGTTDRVHATFKGQFLTDGVVGAVRARVTTVTNSRHRAKLRCDSGTRHFSAVP
jgi:hypothetical protein